MSIDSGVDNHEKAIERLRTIAGKYETEQFVISGVDEDAEQENQRVISVLESMKNKFRDKENSLFAIILTGSRVKGYNKQGSDIELVRVQSDEMSETESYELERMIEEELAKNGLPHVDWRAEWFLKDDIPTTPDGLLYLVDHHSGQMIGLFGYAPYENPNLRITKLAALDILSHMGEHGDMLWENLRKLYNEAHIGSGRDRDRVLVKFAGRMGLKSREVGAILTPALFEERERKFAIGDREAIRHTLHAWYARNKKKLSSYRMAKVYEEMKTRISQGM